MYISLGCFPKNILSTTPSPYSYYSQAKRTYTPIQSVFIENICYSYYTIFLLGKQGQSKVCQIKKRYSRQAISGSMINFGNKKDSQTHPTILGLVRRRQPLFYIILYYICIKNASSLCCQIGTERSCYVDNNFVVHL